MPVWETGTSEMHAFLEKYSGALDPDEVSILIAAFDKAWETVQASGVRYPEAKAELVRAVVCTENSDSDVVVMQSTEERM